MSAHTPKINRGPAAAAENHAAILSAARAQFEIHGYHVPLSTIAKAAGVSQGVFYRHFRSRQDLAIEVFVGNFAELRELARDDDPRAFIRFWNRVLEMTVAEVAFLELVFDARAEFGASLHELDLPALTAPLLTRAQEAGAVPAALTLDDVLLTQRMAYGIARFRDPHEDINQRLQQMLRLLGIPAAVRP
ncbi:MAG: TetR/AcrR family transcriptional regulator [Ruaniaceae bacterium]|nr:TetR/AcrR family transcriptional regulator [Ruaniaceae bacterium]